MPSPALLRPSKSVLTAAVLAATFALASCGGGDDDVSTPSCATQANDTTEKLTACVTLAGVQTHLAEFDRIAKANGNNRSSGTAGFDRSVDYAMKVFGDAGYTVTRQTFTIVAFEEQGDSVLQQLTPAPVADIVHSLMSYSGSGDVSAVVGVVPNLGCDAADFAAFTAGQVALISRGTCPFGQKAANAVTAGAAAVVIYNNAEGELNGTLGDDFTGDLPVVAVTQAIGVQLAATPGLSAHVKATTTRTPSTTYNVLAESAGGDATKVVMVGAHLDSVAEGAGINDNGTGSAAILETAVQMARVAPKQKLRFALWGGEESGLLGSTHYVESLTEEEGAKIALYLNFDMIGSPNPGFFIYDGDNSDATGEDAGPAGSDAIEKVFEAFYTTRNKPFQGTDFDGRSDYGPFIAGGIPAGGLFTGAEDLMTPEQATLWGGEAGIAFDKCYHAACDDLTNLDLDALDLNADAVAHATLRYALDLTGIPARDPVGSLRINSYRPPADMRPKHLPALR